MNKYDALMLSAIEESGLEPEDFGALFYDATAKIFYWEGTEQKMIKARAIGTILSLPSGRELLKAEEKRERRLNRCR